jgi:vanillate O-demethylase ferredoxin subunit
LFVDWLDLVVRTRTEEAPDIASFELVRADGGELPLFEAGAHVDVEVAEGLLRQYSLCNAPRERHRYLLAVLHTFDSRGGSRGLHEQLAAGQPLRVGLPRNHFPLHPGTTRSVLLAGGIGVTPLLAMAEALCERGNEFALHYCTRSAGRTAFAGRLAGAPFAASVHLHHDDGPPSQRFDAAAALGAPDASTHVYVCGPSGFMTHVLQTAHELGWPEARLHREYFSPPAAEPDTLEKEFDVEIASTGQVIRVPAKCSVAKALAEHGVLINMSCEQGICGTCVTTVLAGDPEHRDSYLTEGDRARNDCFTPCCSRAKSKLLVLDL